MRSSESRQGSGEVGGAAGIEEGDEGGVHEGVVVGDIEDGDAFAGEGGFEFSIEAGAMDFFHDEDEVCPLDLLFGQGDFGVGVEAGGVCLDAGMIREDGFGGGAAEFVSGAEEEEVFLRHGWDLRDGASDVHPSPVRSRRGVYCEKWAGCNPALHGRRLAHHFEAGAFGFGEVAGGVGGPEGTVVVGDGVGLFVRILCLGSGNLVERCVN